jgi:hypothetical protein
MIQKPSFTVGITGSGQVEMIKIGTPEECKESFLEAVNNPDGKFVDVYTYRKPPYWKRRKLSTQPAKSAPKKRRKSE